MREAMTVEGIVAELQKTIWTNFLKNIGIDCMEVAQLVFWIRMMCVLDKMSKRPRKNKTRASSLVMCCETFSKTFF